MRIKLACTLFLPLFLAGLLRGADAPASPNIVMIVSDDHAWTDYGFMGHAQLQTPRLDRLAKESLAFRRGYVTSSLCCPSLASLITGRYPHQHCVTSNDPPLPAGMQRKDFHASEAFRQGREAMSRHLESAQPLPARLRDQGYLSLQTGKWWQGDFSRGGFTHGMTKGGRHGDAGLDIGRKTMQPIYDFIRTARTEKKPFFIWYAPMMPHDPHTPPQRLLDRYQPRTPSIHQARYWSMVEWFDETVGELLDHLDQQGLAQDTLVVYLADNGWIQNADNPRFDPRSKQSQYDGGLRTPIMLRWPGRIQPRMADELASSIDLVPTLLKAVGQKPAADLPGINLLDAKALAARDAIFGECFTHNAVEMDKPASSLRWRWIIEYEWKLIVPNAVNEPDAKIELFHIAKDPLEQHNLVDSQAERVSKLRERLNAWWSP